MERRAYVRVPCTHMCVGMFGEVIRHGQQTKCDVRQNTNICKTARSSFYLSTLRLLPLFSV